MRIILITTLFLLPISAVAAAELHHFGAVHRSYAISDASLDRCAYQRTPFFWPTPADLAFARRLCVREGLPRKEPYFDFPW
jgi:hypothetical protein